MRLLPYLGVLLFGAACGSPLALDHGWYNIETDFITDTTGRIDLDAIYEARVLIDQDKDGRWRFGIKASTFYGTEVPKGVLFTDERECPDGSQLDSMTILAQRVPGGWDADGDYWGRLGCGDVVDVQRFKIVAEGPLQ